MRLVRYVLGLRERAGVDWFKLDRDRIAKGLGCSGKEVLAAVGQMRGGAASSGIKAKIRNGREVVFQFEAVEVLDEAA